MNGFIQTLVFCKIALVRKWPASVSTTVSSQSGGLICKLAGALSHQLPLGVKVSSFIKNPTTEYNIRRQHRLVLNSAAHQCGAIIVSARVRACGLAVLCAACTQGRHHDGGWLSSSSPWLAARAQRHSQKLVRMPSCVPSSVQVRAGRGGIAAASTRTSAPPRHRNRRRLAVQNQLGERGRERQWHGCDGMRGTQRTAEDRGGGTQRSWGPSTHHDDMS